MLAQLSHSAHIFDQTSFWMFLWGGLFVCFGFFLFFGMKLMFKLVNFKQTRLPSIMLVGLIHLSESLKRTKTDLPLDKKGFCWLMAFIFELQHHFSLGLQPAACSLMCTFWNCSLHNPMSQFFSVNSLSLSIYIFFLLVLFLWRTLTQCSTLRLCV